MGDPVTDPQPRRPRLQRRAQRRRQRSVRVTVAVTLMSVGTAAVLVAVTLADAVVLSGAALLALVCGWASVRILWTEVRQSRRLHAADRAAQARAFRELVTERSAEHATFAAAMTDRLVTRDREVEQLSDALQRYAERAAEAEDRVRREAGRVAEAQQRVRELQTAFSLRAAEHAGGLPGPRSARPSGRAAALALAPPVPERPDGP